MKGHPNPMKGKKRGPMPAGWVNPLKGIKQGSRNWPGRFWAKVDRSAGPNACWPFTGKIDRWGYGHIHFEGRTHVAHRIAVMLDGREVPEGMEVDHACKNRRCVNPAHLRVVTFHFNRVTSSDSFCARNSRKTHCPQGHAYTPENTALVPCCGPRKKARGTYKSRTCLTCFPWHWRHAVVPREKPPPGYCVEAMKARKARRQAKASD